MCQVHLPIHTSQEEVVVVGGIELDLLLLKLWEPGIGFIPSRAGGESDGRSVSSGLLEMGEVVGHLSVSAGVVREVAIEEHTTCAPRAEEAALDGPEHPSADQSEGRLRLVMNPLGVSKRAASPSTASLKTFRSIAIAYPSQLACLLDVVDSLPWVRHGR